MGRPRITLVVRGNIQGKEYNTKYTLQTCMLRCEMSLSLLRLRASRATTSCGRPPSSSFVRRSISAARESSCNNNNNALYHYITISAHCNAVYRGIRLKSKSECLRDSKRKKNYRYGICNRKRIEFITEYQHEKLSAS